MAVGGVDVRVENHLVRFVPTSPVNHDAVVSQLAGQKNGSIVIKSLEKQKKYCSSLILTSGMNGKKILLKK